MNALQKSALVARALPSLVGAAARAAWKAASGLTIEPFYELGAQVSTMWSHPSYAVLARKSVRNVYALRAISLIAEALASLDLYVKQASPSGDKLLDRHPLLDLLKRGISLTGGRVGPRGVWTALVMHLYFAGEWWWEPVGPETGGNAGKPRRLRLHRPDRVSERTRNEAYEVTAWDVRDRAGRGRVLQAAMPGERVTNGVLVQSRIYNPTNDERGLPLAIAALRAIDTFEAADVWNKSVSEQGGRIPGFFEPQGLPPGENLSADDVEASQARLDERWKDRNRLSLPMVLSGAYKFVTGALTPKEADFLEKSREDARRICAAFGLDPALVGDSSNRTYSNLKEARRALFILTVLPIADFLLDDLNSWLTPLFGDGLEVVYDKDQIEALQEDMTEKYKRYGEAGFLTIDEKREAVGWPALKPEQRKEILVPFNLVPLDDVAGSGGLRGTGQQPPAQDDESEKALKTLASMGDLDGWLDAVLPALVIRDDVSREGVG